MKQKRLGMPVGAPLGGLARDDWACACMSRCVSKALSVSILFIII